MAINFQNSNFVTSVAKLFDLPDSSLPEIAFAGRSNVGKSSLINALVNNKKLAKTSNTPGRTQLLNFFDIDEKLHLVDMPGYGYAKISRKTVKEWSKLIMNYLSGRAQLQRIFLLIDARHGLKENDIQIMKIFDEKALNYQIILTKCDKNNKEFSKKIFDNVADIVKNHAAAHPKVIMTSAEKKYGIDELKLQIEELIEIYG